MNDISYRIRRRLDELSMSKTDTKLPSGKRAMIQETNELLMIQDAAFNGDIEAVDILDRIRDLNKQFDTLKSTYRKLDPWSKTQAIIDLYVITLEKISLIQRFNLPKKVSSIYLKKLAREKKEAIAQRKTDSHE